MVSNPQMGVSSQVLPGGCPNRGRLGHIHGFLGPSGPPKPNRPRMKTLHFSRTCIAALAVTAVSLASFAQNAAQSPSPTGATTPTVTAAEDPYLWLEEVQGEKSLAWVRERNAASETLLRGRPEFEPIRSQALKLLASTDKVPYVGRQGAYLINVWTDATNKRGLLRRTTLAEYQKGSADGSKTTWETVLDIDALGAQEKENWVYKGMSCLAPQHVKCLVHLSRGGADAVVVREWNMDKKAFVSAAEGGFFLPEAKQQVQWFDADTLIVGSDFGPGTLTKSGYARMAKAWKRGTPLADAKLLFEGKVEDVSAGVGVDRTVLPARLFAFRSVDFWNNETSLLGEAGSATRIDKPSDASFNADGAWAYITPRADWTVGGKTYKGGSLLVADFAAYMRGERSFTVLFEPTATQSLAGSAVTERHVVLNVLDNVAGRLVEWAKPEGGKGWVRRELPDVAPGSRGTLSLQSWADPVARAAGQSDPFANNYTLNYADFLTPDSFYLAQSGTDTRSLLRQLPQRFDAAGMKAEQRFALSKDGTRVPYFVVLPKNAVAGKPLPTMLYGYGGFRQPQRPFYSGSWGNAWLARGGAVVVANIRGGGEFGPSWHQAALKANRQKSFDDFIAIAEDLIKSGTTSPKQLGIYGGSNGGLLTGAVAVQRPELFGAVISAVPLLDMRRYHVLLAGNSWMGEYGNPDVAAEWEYIQKYSPYQNLKKGVKYPRILFTTSTRDDRVHPGHARKMVARMLEQGHEVLYYENIEGGHGGAADTLQRADLTGLQFAYLWMQLGGQ